MGYQITTKIEFSLKGFLNACFCMGRALIVRFQRTISSKLAKGHFEGPGAAHHQPVPAFSNNKSRRKKNKLQQPKLCHHRGLESNILKLNKECLVKIITLLQSYII